MEFVLYHVRSRNNSTLTIIIGRKSQQNKKQRNNTDPYDYLVYY